LRLFLKNYNSNKIELKLLTKILGPNFSRKVTEDDLRKVKLWLGFDPASEILLQQWDMLVEELRGACVYLMFPGVVAFPEVNGSN